MANSISVRRASKGSKRRSERNILTFYEKIAVIRYYNETNISRNSLAKMFHCCATQIRRILERKDELLQQLASLSEADASIIIEEMTRKRRKFEMCAISFILHQWVERCRQMRLSKRITNQTLKDTALKMAAILNLPTFRPSYRWLNRFRGKYKYNDQDLGSTGPDTVSGELSVEDIIIEFKDSLPSFMQKEISAITASTKVDEIVAHQINSSSSTTRTPTPTPTTSKEHSVPLNENSKDFNVSGEDENDETEEDDQQQHENDEYQNITTELNNTQNGKEENENGNVNETATSAGTTALLNSVFPHLAVIHQFALLNSDVKALELISQLGVHMQSQAVEGAYKQMSLGTPSDVEVYTNSHSEGVDGETYATDLDDIVLIE